MTDFVFPFSPLREIEGLVSRMFSISYLQRKNSSILNGPLYTVILSERARNLSTVRSVKFNLTIQLNLSYILRDTTFFVYHKSLVPTPWNELTPTIPLSLPVTFKKSSV